MFARRAFFIFKFPNGPLLFFDSAARHASERFLNVYSHCFLPDRTAGTQTSRRAPRRGGARTQRAMGRKNGRKAKGARGAGEAADDEASDGESGGAIDAASLTLTRSNADDDDGPEATCAVATDEVTLELPGDDGTPVGTPDDTRGAVAGGWRGFFGRRGARGGDDGSDTEPESTPAGSRRGTPRPSSGYSGNSSASVTPRVSAVRVRGMSLREGDEDAESVGSMSGDELLDLDGDPDGGEERSPGSREPGSAPASPRVSKGGIAGFGSPRFLKSFRRALSKRSSTGRRSDNGDAGGANDDEMDDETRTRLEAKREKKARKETKRRAKKARRRLKRLVHATNTMGAAVSAKDETNTQLALCMQLGLTMALRAQKPASSIDWINDPDALERNDSPMTLNVGRKAVVDGSTLPAFRFIVHAPDRFEKVRAAWGLNLGTYQESFALRPARRDPSDGAPLENLVPGADEWRDAIASHELLGRGLEENTAEEDHARYAAAAAARRESQNQNAISRNFAQKPREGATTTEPDPPGGRHSRRASAASSVGEPPNATGGAAGDRNAAGGGGSVGGKPPSTHARRHSVHSVGSVGTDADSDAAYDPDGFQNDQNGFQNDGFSSGYDSDGRGGASRLLPSTTSLRVISTANASGKSSSWFYCSKDGRFLVKTCTTKEKDVLTNILREYSAHAEANRGVSLLPQYYGLYSIEVGRRSAHFIIMNYWFASMHEINLRYDLKGSTKGRRASAKERAKGPSAIYKDLDRIERGTIVENKMASEIKAAIANDVEFMRRNRLIDYSMMLGVHFKTDGAARDGDDGEAGAGGAQTGGAAGSESDAQGVVSSDGGGAFDERSGGVPPQQPRDAPPSAAVLAAERDEPQPPSARDPRGGGGYFVDVYAGASSDAEAGGPPSAPPSPSFATTRDHHARGGGRLARIESNKPMEREGSEFFSKEDDRTLQFQLRALDTPQGLAYLGIIDILTQYTAAKAQETFWCGYVVGCGADISCQPPSRYARRFLRMLDSVLVEPRGEGSEEGGGGTSRGGSGRSMDLARANTNA